MENKAWLIIKNKSGTFWNVVEDNFDSEDMFYDYELLSIVESLSKDDFSKARAMSRMYSLQKNYNKSEVISNTEAASTRKSTVCISTYIIISLTALLLTKLITLII